MTNKDLERVENRLLAIVEQSATDDACNAAKTLVDVFCQLEEIKMRKEQHAQYVREFEREHGEVKSAEATPCNVRDEEEDRDQELLGYVQDDGSDRWGARKFRVYIDGMDSETWRQIKNYVYGYGNNSYSVGDNDLHTAYFWITRSCWGVMECPKGEYKLFEEDVHQLMKDLKALFPGVVDRRGLTWVKR